MADYSVEIARLEAILNAGTQYVGVDGMQTFYNLPEVRKRLSELRALDDSTIERNKARPRSATIRLHYH